MEKKKKPAIRFKGFTDSWEQRKFDKWGDFYYGHSCPKWSVTEDATIPCIRYGELYTKFGAKIDKVYSYTNMPTEKLRFSKGTEVLIPRVGEDPMDYNHCTWLSLKDVAIGEMISVFNTDQDPLFSATMFNATLQKEFAIRVEGGSVTNLYFDKLRNIDISYPLLAEQKKIAAFFENLDHLITLHQRKYDKLQIIKKAMLEKMFPQNGSCFPEIRFKGFTDSWEQRKLGDVVNRVTRKNQDLVSELPLTISAQYGLIDQNEFFDKRVASKDVSGYYLIENGEFAYNKSTSTDAPWGAVKRLDHYENGVLSTLYIVFGIKENNPIDSNFLVSYYNTNLWHKGIREIAAEGARNHGLLNIVPADFFETELMIPQDIEEQKQRLNLALKQMDLEFHKLKLPNELSGGQQQRVALARAMVTRPDVILFDEPLSNLDAKLRESVRFEIKQLSKQYNLTSIYVTHDQAEALTMSDKIIVLNKGSIEQIGSPQDIYHHPKNRFVADFIGIANITEANVKNIGDNLYSVSSIFGDFTVFSEKKPESERIYICFRPEDIELLPNAQTEAENQITVDIINTAFMGNITEVQGIIKRNDEEKKLRLQLTKCPNLSDKLTFTIPRHAIKFLESVK